MRIGIFIIKLPSPRALVGFYRNFESLGLEACDLMERYVYRTSAPGVNSSYWWSKTGRGLQIILLHLLIDSANSVINHSGYIATTGIETVHEYAHRTRDTCIGQDTGMHWPGYGHEHGFS